MDKKSDFDLDDPLGDLLSDNSNDSFFKDDDNYKPQNFPKPGESSLDKKKMNLFGLENEVTEPKKLDFQNKETANSDDWLGLVEKTSASAAVIPIKNSDPKSLTEKVSTSSTFLIDQNIIKPSRGSYPDSLNFLDDLGLSDNENEMKKDGAKKSSILDNLLGKSPKRPDSFPQINIKKDNLQTGGYNPSNLVGKISNKTEEYKNKSFKGEENKNVDGKSRNIQNNESRKEVPTPSMKETSAIPKRQRSNTDWLGLELYPDDEDNLNILGSKDKSKGQTNLDWLNPSAIINEKTKVKVDKEDRNKSKLEGGTSITKTITDNKDSEDILVKTDLTNVQLNNFDELLLNPMKANLKNESLLSTCDVAEQSAAICLQQQESQLMVALQLKAQEERLAGLTERHEESRKVQHEMMSSHRQQIDKMLQGHVKQREQLQQIIAQRQDRINQHIQLLLRPSSALGNKESNANEENVGNNDSKKEKITEKMQLEQIILNLKENHNREIDFMESSYRRQIQILDDSLIQIEERLKSENEKLSRYYLARIDMLEKENTGVLNLMDEKMKHLLDKHNIERESIEKKHQNDMLILQQQNENVIKNIRDTFTLEKETVRECSSYSQSLNEVLRGVQENNAMCASFIEKVDSHTNSENKERERVLKLKEEQITQMIDSLQKQRISFELESQSMKSALQTLEDSLKQQIMIMGEERLVLKQREKSMEMEKEIFQRECETARKILSNDKENIKISMQNIHDKEIEMERKLSEKMEKINVDKLTAENDKKITENLKTQSQNLKLSLDSELDILKENKNKLLHEEKRLQQENAALLTRSQELEMLTRSALAKQVNADRKASEAEYARQRYEERLKRMQEQTIALNAREQQIARDKVTLSRERLALHDQLRQTQLSQCGLCKTINTTHKMNKPNKYDTQNRDFDFLEMMVTKDKYFEQSKDEFNNKVLQSVSDAVFRNESGNDENNHSAAVEREMNSLQTVHHNNLDRTAAFQEIVDPKLLLLTLDVKNATQHLNC